MYGTGMVYAYAIVPRQIPVYLTGPMFKLTLGIRQLVWGILG